MAINNGLSPGLESSEKHRQRGSWTCFCFTPESFIIVVTEREKTTAGKSSLIIGEGYWREYLDNTWSTSIETLNIFAHARQP